MKDWVSGFVRRVGLKKKMSELKFDLQPIRSLFAAHWKSFLYNLLIQSNNLSDDFRSVDDQKVDKYLIFLDFVSALLLTSASLSST